MSSWWSSFGCYSKIHLWQTFDRSTICVGKLCSAAGYILPPARLWITSMNIVFVQEIVFSYHWSVHPSPEIRYLFTIGSKLEPFNQNLTKFTFLSTLPANLRCYAKRNSKPWVCSRCTLWIYRFVKKQRYKVLVDLWRFMLRILKFKRNRWFC